MHTSHSTTDRAIPSIPNPETTQASPPPRNDPQSRVPSGLIIVVSLTLLCSFFLPWINFLGVDLSGFDLQKLSDASLVFWAIPFLAFCTAVLTLANAGSNFTRYLAALSPYGILVIAVTRYGPEIIQHLKLGAWLALIAGAALVSIPVPERLQKGA